HGQQLRLAGALTGDEPPGRGVHRGADGQQAVALAAAYLLLGLFGREGSRAAAGRMLVSCGSGLALVAVALAALHQNGDRTFLVDGSSAMRSWAIPELARVSYVGKHVTLFGMPLVKATLVASFVGLALVAGVVPLHSWLGPVLASAPPAVSAMLVAGLSRAALLGWLRVDVGVLPESVRWAAPVLGAVACAGALYAALAAMGQRDLLRTVGFGVVASSSLALLGSCSLTPEGVLGFVEGAATSGAAGAVAILALGALHERTGTLVVRELRGLGVEAPVLAASLAVAVLAVGAMPGCATFWGAWLVTLGLVPREPGLALGAAAAAILAASAMASPLLAVVRGRLPERLRGGETLAPFGGHVPELRPAELGAILPLVAVLVLLGFYPAPLLGKAATTVRDYGELVDPEGPTKISSTWPGSEDEERGALYAVVDRRLAVAVVVVGPPEAQPEAQARDRIGE
ncbi:MAG TPA: proton-conducting transporter membrane subunit, partial [Polyangiaceae bacterium]|nr:proton-conducting transporter membrane subunit [Polyangiaceae bacterium]